MKRLTLSLIFVLCVSVLLRPQAASSATFTDNFDNPSFTNSNWMNGTAVPQTWSFVTISGSDLGYHASSTDKRESAAKFADNGREYYNSNLYMETLLRIDSHADKYSTENRALVGFSIYDTGSGYNGYWTGIELDYAGPTNIALQIGLIGENDYAQTPVNIDFDIFYKLVVQVDPDQNIAVFLYALDGTLLGSLFSPKVLPAIGGSVAIGAKPEATFNDFYLTGNPVQ